LAVLRAAEKEYEANTGETHRPLAAGLLARYTRNLALASQDLTAGIFDLAVAARGIADDNYAGDVVGAASKYLRQREEADLPPHASSGRRSGSIRAASGCGRVCLAPSRSCGPMA
jgi:hypothetical protein